MVIKTLGKRKCKNCDKMFIPLEKWDWTCQLCSEKE